MIRKILGVVFGIVVAMLAISGGQMALHLLVPMPPVDMQDPEAVKTMMASAPMAGKLGLALVYAVATFFGAAVAASVAKGRWAGWTITVVLLMLTVANFVMLPHPVWLVALCLVGIAGAGWFATRMGAKA